MFSPLARGVGTWTGDIHTRDDICQEDVLPLLPINQDYHPHGITISPRLYSAATRAQPSEKSNGELVLPKTFITRKGALMLFTAPDDFDELSEDDNLYLKKAHQFLRTHYAEQIAKLGKLSRLAQSILMFGDENYSKEDTSISDADNKIILKFLHELDTDHCDKKSKPGSDLSIYLRDLRSRRSSARSSFSPADGRKSSESFLIPSRETTTLSADAQSLVSQLRPNSATDDKASIASSCRSTHRVLSADKLRASLKSNSYLGRPSPTPAPLVEERVIYPYTPPVSRRSSATSITYKHGTPLLEHRHRSRTAVDGIGNRGDRVQVSQAAQCSNAAGVHTAQRTRTSASVHTHDAQHTSKQHSPRVGEMQIRIIDNHDPDDAKISQIMSPSLSEVCTDHTTLHSVSHTNLPNESGFIKTWSQEGTAAEQDVIFDNRPPMFDVKESISGREHVQRYLEDIQSEGIGEESIVEIPSSRGDLLPDDLQADDYEEYDEDELELFEEQSFDETPTATQPLIPLYNNTRQVSNGKFSISDAEAANITNDNVTGHLSDVDQSLQESPEVMQDLDDDSDDNDVVGVTAVDIINSHRGSDTSSHSGFPSDDVCTEVVENIPAVGSSRIRSARGQRVRSAVGQRVQSSKGRRIHSASGEREAHHLEEESIDVIVDAPPAPPGTRTASPTAIQDDGSEASKESTTVPSAAEPDTTGSDLIRHGASEPDTSEPDAPEPDTAAADEEVSDIRKLERLESGLLAGEQETNKQHLMTSTDDAKQIEISSRDEVDVLKSDLVHETSSPITNETVSKPKTDHVTKKADPLAEHPDQVKDPSVEADEINTQKITHDDGETKVIDVVKNKKVKNVVKAKEKSKVKSVSGTKEPSKEVSKVKQTTKQYSKPLDVTQIASPKKKTPEKKEPLLQGLESYATKTKDAPKKPDQGKKLEVKVQPKQDTSGSNLIPSPPPPKSKEEMALDQIEKEDIYSQWRRKPKRQHSVTEILGNKTEDTGFSAEEMQIEHQLLKERLEAAQQKVKGEPSSSPTPKRSTRNKKEPKKGKKEKDKKDDKNNEDLTKQREALREARRLEKMKRLEDAKKLEEQIKEKEEAKRQSEAESDRKAQALREQIEMIAREAAEARRLEEEAQQQMAAQRRQAREEREGRRKADLERKKREAAKHREHEKKMMEAAKVKERQMLARIADAEHRRMIEEEERKRREEEELFEEQEKEAEEQELERLAEEEEEKLRELERQAEEEALAFLIREREEAEARQRALMEQVAWEEHQQELQRKQIEGEKAKLEEQMRKQQEEEMSKFEEEKKRYEELQNIEHAALECLRQEMEQKRSAALRRRELNLERRKHLNKLAHGQGMTRPWVFTYYVHWPREMYEKRMGQDPKKKGSKSLKKPKPRQ